MRRFKKHRLLILFILGLLLRLGLLFLDYSWDVNNHLSWSKDLWQRGFAGFYDKQSSEVYATLYPNYPPVALFIFYIFYPLQSIIHGIAWFINTHVPLFPSKLIFFIETRTFLAATLKLPAVLADLGLALIVYLITEKSFWKESRQKLRRLIESKKDPIASPGPVWNLASLQDDKKKNNAHTYSLLMAALILFNPAFFYNSAYWGQIDVIPIFFVVWSLYLLIFTKRFMWSGVIFTFAVLTKPTALVFLPIYAVIFIQKYSFKEFFKTSLLGLFIFLLSFIPFLGNFNLLLPFTIYSPKRLAAQSLPYVTNGAFNFWVLVTWFKGIKDTAPFLLGISYRVWGYILTSIFVVITLFFQRHSGKSRRMSGRFQNRSSKQQFRNDIFYVGFLIAFACFLFLTKMHERYSMLPLPFLLLASIQNRKLLRWFIVLSFISFLNLYHSWPVPRIEPLVEFIFYPPTVIGISLINVLLFLYLFKLLLDRHSGKRPSNSEGSASRI